MSRPISRQRFLALLGTAVPALALAACGGSAAVSVSTSSATATAAPAASATTSSAAASAVSTSTAAATSTVAASSAAPAANTGKQVVRYTMFGHDGIAEKNVALFNQTHPDVQVQFERSPGQNYGQKVTAAMAGGNAWDAFRAPSGGFVTHYGPAGAIIDVSPYQDRDKTYPTTLWLDGTIDAFAVNGKRYGVPPWCLTQWLFYNKKLFDDAKIPYPTPNTTWDEFVQMTKELTKTDSSGTITQYGTNGWGGWNLPLAQDIWSAGGQFYYNQDMTKFAIDDPTTVQVLQDEADLQNKYKVMPSPLNPPSSPVSLLTKKVATEINGDWYSWDQRDQWSPDFDATLTPLRNGKRVNCYMPDALVINAQSKVKDGAYAWISWWSADPASWANQGAVVFPPIKREYEDATLRDQWLKAPYRQPGMIATALQHEQQHQIWKYGVADAEFESKVLYTQLDNIWRGKSSAKDAAAAMTQQGNAIIAKSAQ